MSNDALYSPVFDTSPALLRCKSQVLWPKCELSDLHYVNGGKKIWSKWVASLELVGCTAQGASFPHKDQTKPTDQSRYEARIVKAESCSTWCAAELGPL
jgi:hypothetical protein